MRVRNVPKVLINQTVFRSLASLVLLKQQQILEAKMHPTVSVSIPACQPVNKGTVVFSFKFDRIVSI